MPISSTDHLFPWRRLWSPLKAGQLQEQPAPNTGSKIDAAKTFDELSHYRCLILLGPPGSRKTTEISAALDQATSRGDPAYFLTLRNVTSRDDLVSELGSFLRSTSAPDELNPVIYMDGLDEAPVRSDEIKTWVLSWLRSIRWKFENQFTL